MAGVLALAYVAVFAGSSSSGNSAVLDVLDSPLPTPTPCLEYLPLVSRAGG